MKIGILTFHHVANYGAVWQTICLSSAFRNLGHDVEVINFRHPRAEKIYLKHMLLSRHAPFNLLKTFRLGAQLKRDVRLSPQSIRNPAALYQIAKNYEAVVVGSDEVWNIEGIRGWTPAYFLDFVPDECRKISYAASTGHRINTVEHGEKLARLLKRFNAISVRDQTSADVIEDLTGKRPPIVVDPTLLTGEQCHRRNFGDYIALYGGLDKETKQWVRHVTSAQGIKIVSIGFSNRVGGKMRITAGLLEWLNIIGNSRLVITTTFHGLLAAIVHRRPFWLLPRVDNSSKVKDFLYNFDLEHRMLNPSKLPLSINLENNIEFDILWEKISKDITISKNFISSALDV